MTIEDIALQMTPGIGVKGAVHLLGVFGSARNIFAAAPDELAGEAGREVQCMPRISYKELCRTLHRASVTRRISKKHR